MAVDQQAHHDLIKDATRFLDELTTQLIESYDDLRDQELSLDDLGNAINAVAYANEKLKSQKVELESYRKRLLSNVTTIYDEDNHGKEKERNT